MATNEELSDELPMKTYNNVDCNEQLMYVKVADNRFAGYRRELLVNPLNELEIDFYVCTECKGVMRNACQVGEEQNLVCEGCVKKGVPSQSMVKSRKKISELQAICPIAIRDCKWNGILAEVQTHLIVCEKVVVKCENGCNVIFPRSELDFHLKHSCVKREMECEHCNKPIVYEKLVEQHYDECLEYQVPCPKNCNVDLKRKLIGSHLDKECPNMEVECPYKMFGCERELLRRELEEHKITNQIQHLESMSLFVVREMEQLKQTNIQLVDRVGNTLENKVEKLSYPIILRDQIFQTGFISKSFEVIWKLLKIGLSFNTTNSCKNLSVNINMYYDEANIPLAKLPFEGRFKLTIIDNIEMKNSLVYESKFVKLQPRKLVKGVNTYQCQYLSNLFLTYVPMDYLQEHRFTVKGNVKFTLQIQEIEDQ